MKIRTFLILSVLLTPFCLSPAFAQMQHTLQASPNQSIKLYTAKKYQPAGNTIPMSASAPAPLSDTTLRMRVGQLQKQAGIPFSPRSMSSTQKITITPDKPIAGDNYLGLVDGKYSSKFNYAVVHSHGYFFFYFDTVPGKTYLVDFTVSLSKNWSCEGALSCQAQPQNGHLLIAFTAAETSTYIKIKPADNSYGRFHSAQLIPVN